MYLSMDAFDYAAPAELYHPTGRSRKAALSFRRFATSALAIKFAIEDVSAAYRGGAVLEVNEVRFDAAVILQLYESAAFPLLRTPPVGIPAAIEAKDG
jgi:hypothetical protein